MGSIIRCVVGVVWICIGCVLGTNGLDHQVRRGVVVGACWVLGACWVRGGYVLVSYKLTYSHTHILLTRMTSTAHSHGLTCMLS